jgi:hypothetical protein
LNASASVPGNLVYTPAAGAIPAAGTDTLSVTFTPTDTTNYSTVTRTVSLIVNQAAPVITWAPPASITYGTPVCRPTQNSGFLGTWFAYPLWRTGNAKNHESETTCVRDVGQRMQTPFGQGVEIEGYPSKQTPTFANRGNDHGIYIHLQAPRPEIHPELDLLGHTRFVP